MWDRQSQFDRWRSNPIADPEVFLGRTFIFVDVGQVPPEVSGAFEKVEKTRKVIHTEGGAPIAICDKQRRRAGEIESMTVIGDVRGKRCVLVDDIVDSGGTLCNAADILLEAGAKEVMAYITHGVFSGAAVERIGKSRLKSLVVTDSIQPTEEVKGAKNIRVLSIAPLIAEAIKRTANEESVSGLFYDY